MSHIGAGERCPVCEYRHLLKVAVDLTFQQITERGRVACHVALPGSLCVHCGFQTLDPGADRVMNDAAHREYVKRPAANGWPIIAYV